LENARCLGEMKGENRYYREGERAAVETNIKPNANTNNMFCIKMKLS
jgi:hypothetical protein